MAKHNFPTKPSSMPADMGFKSCPESDKYIKKVGGTTNENAGKGKLMTNKEPSPDC